MPGSVQKQRAASVQAKLCAAAGVQATERGRVEEWQVNSHGQLQSCQAGRVLSSVGSL